MHRRLAVLGIPLAERVAHRELPLRLAAADARRVGEERAGALRRAAAHIHASSSLSPRRSYSSTIRLHGMTPARAAQAS